jgi:hypothetical protein
MSLSFSADGHTLLSGCWDTTALVWDVTGRRNAPAALTSESLDACWADLARNDAARAFQAVGRLANAPDQAVPFLKQHLQPMALVDAKRFAALTADLGSEEFAVRQRATAELEKFGEQDLPALRKAMVGNPSPEARKRLQTILDALAHQPPAGERLRSLRALAVLEYVGSREARRLLEVLARGAPEARLTREAKASLARLAARTSQ